MNFPEVSIILQNGRLGRVDDLGNGVPGLIVLMASSPTGHAFGDVKSYSRFVDLPAELKLVKALEYYFALADGYKIYIMPVASTTVISEAVDPVDDLPYAKQLMEAGNGEIRFIGVVGTMLLAAMAATIGKAQDMYEYSVAQKSPLRVFLPYSFRTADVISALTSLTDNGVGVVVSYRGDEIGLLLGRLASTPVQRHPGRVKDGPMPITDARLDGAAGTPTNVEDDMVKVKALHDAGYIVLGILIGKAGYYFMGMPMATANTDDYGTIVNCRTIDKAFVVAYGVYLNELNEEVYVDAEGKLQAGYVKHMQAAVEEAIDRQMTANGEISGRKAFFDDQQDVIATSEVSGSLDIQPVGHSSKITINLGLTNSIA
ncbi:MAG TPA: DUF2586 family protein [Lentimicrobium sp.]|nr:DUF2586 family protein [Bacteroidales bacterium]HLO92417.1 DUF2586 family protein [Lentimicrobium sp.]